MNETDVVDLLKMAEHIGIDVWIDGGWGVDALVGHQTRLHNDIDIFIEKKNAAKFMEFLTARNYQEVKMDYTTADHTVWRDCADRIIDLHLFEFDKADMVYYENEPYPADVIRSKGSIGGLAVKCFTAEAQLQFHQGYEYSEKDTHDVFLLCNTFGLAVPEEYRSNYIKKVTIGKPDPLNGKIILEEYNTNWPITFEREAEKILNALGDKALQIHHVGSTAVPGLCAKPIIDMLLVVSDSSDESAYIPALETAGYSLRIREPDWFEHRLLKGSETAVNLHVFSEHTSEIERMLAFRDWLRSNESDRKKYEQAKRELARYTWNYVQHYADAKTAVIAEIMRMS